MGYTTDFSGRFSFDKKLDESLHTYLNRFADVRHMGRDVDKLMRLDENWKDFSFNGNLGKQGEYYVGEEDDGRSIFCRPSETSVIDYNRPPDNCPGLWCQWVVSDDGMHLEWDGGEKFYYYEEWLDYLINNFIAPSGYVLNGEVEYQGEDYSDFGKIICENNVIRVVVGVRVYNDDLRGLSDEELVDEMRRRGYYVE